MRDSDTYSGLPTIGDYRLISEEGATSRRRFQDWISAGAIAAIVLSLQLVGNHGIDRWILASGIALLFSSVSIAAVDQSSELWLLLDHAKYAQRVALHGEELPPQPRRVWLRKSRYYLFFVQVGVLLMGLLLVIVAAFTQPS